MTFVVICVLLFLLELVYFRLADRWNIVDKPNERSSHSALTLRGGGVVFPIAVLSYFLLYGFSYPLFVLGLVLISAVSFWDDVRPLSNKVRLAVHFAAMLLMFQQWDLFRQYPLLVVPALILCAGIINAFNFMDGINGITGAYSLVVLAGLGWVNRFETEFVDPNLIGVVIAAVLVFCFFNFRTKARCFAGDVGSVSVAFIVLFVLGLLVLRTLDFTWIVFLAVYGVDSVLTIVHRLLLKENIFKPHRKHLYQLLANELRFPHLAVSSVYMLVQAAVIAGYLFCRPLGRDATWCYVAVVLAILVFIYVFAQRRWFHLHLHSIRHDRH